LPAEFGEADIPLAFYPQCPICGQTGSTYRSLGIHYKTDHPEFYAQSRRLNGQFKRITLAFVLIALGLSRLIFIGLTRLLILGWGAIMLGWFAYFLLFWQPKLDDLSDKSNDEWRNNSRPSTLDQTVQAASSRKANSIVCPICKLGPYRLGLGIRYHNRIHHMEYFKWYRGWSLLMEKISILTVLVFLGLFSTGLLDPLASSGFAPLILVVPAFSLAVVFATNRSKKQRESRIEWIQNHPH